MSDQKSKTVALDAGEWQGVVLVNLGVLQRFVTGTALLTDDHLPHLDNHIERLKTLLHGWRIASAQAIAAQNAQQQTVVEVPEANLNGAAPKKPGWPKGKPRTRKPAVTAVVQ